MLTLFRRTTLTHWIVVGMASGILLGWLVPEFALKLAPLSTLFLRLIKSIIAPILFGTLVVGIAGHGDDMKRVGRLALKSFAYFWAMTAIALVVGLVFGNLFRPGDGVVLPPPDPKADIPQAVAPTFAGFIEHAFPASFFDAASKNYVLQVVVWSTLFAIALAQAPAGRAKDTVLAFSEGIAEVMFKFVALIMNFAPVGIAAAMAYTVAHSGIGVMLDLAKLVATLYGALIVFTLVALLPIALYARIPIREFVRKVKEPALIAFTTTSSDSALPLAMQRMIEFGVPRRIVAFVMPTGYSFNLDGSTLYLGVASLFVAQAANIELSLGQQVLMMLTLLLTSKGIAAVPRASMVVLSGALASFGLPLEGLVLILGVDVLMDMARTTINLIGNCLATAVMARWEGEWGNDETPKSGGAVANAPRAH